MVSNTESGRILVQWPFGVRSRKKAPLSEEEKYASLGDSILRTDTDTHTVGRNVIDGGDTLLCLSDTRRISKPLGRVTDSERCGNPTAAGITSDRQIENVSLSVANILNAVKVRTAFK